MMGFLKIAISENDAGALRAIIPEGDPEVANRMLVSACADGNIECVKWILNNRHPTEWCELHVAVSVGQTSSFSGVMYFDEQYEIVKCLLERGWNPNRPDIVGKNALHYGIVCHRMTEMLIQSGAHVDSRSANGDTPLSSAIRMNYEKSVRVLFQHGAKDRGIYDTNKDVWVDKIRDTVLECKRRYVSATTAIMHVLRKRGAPKDMTQWFGKTYMKPHWRGDVWLYDEDGTAAEKKNKI
jgi:hypothetical protein